MTEKFSMMRVVKSLVLVGALILPAVSWADDHLLDINGAAVFTIATMTHAGTLNPSLVLAAGFSGEGSNLTFTPVAPLSLVNIPVKICTLGTNGQLEWLDQGTAAVGVSGTLTATSPTASYSLVLSGTPSSSYGASNGPCIGTPQGTPSYTFVRNAVITKTVTAGGAVSNALTSTYNFWNVSGTVPVPGTIFLMLIGMAGLGWMSIKRRRQM